MLCNAARYVGMRYLQCAYPMSSLYVDPINISKESLCCMRRGRRLAGMDMVGEHSERRTLLTHNAEL